MTIFDDFINKFNNLQAINNVERSSHELAEQIASSPLANPAKWAYENIQKLICDFEASLND